MTQLKLYTYSTCPRNPLHLKHDYHVPILVQNHHDHATLCHSNIINSGLLHTHTHTHTHITSYIQANIYKFIYST